LALELGWTYQQAPSALVAACREHGLPLVVLHEVFAFVEITEQVQSAILERATAGAVRERDLRQVLTDALLDGAGPQELTAVLAHLLAAPVVVTTAEGALVAASGVDRDSSGRRSRPVARRDVVLLDRHWGQVAVLPPARADDPLVPAACTYGAEALGLALLRSAAGADLDVRRRQLVDDLTERRWRAPGELVARARVLGLPFPADGRYSCLVVTDLAPADPDAVVRAVMGALAPGTALVADVGEDVVAVVRTSAVMAAARSVLRAIDALPADRARVVAGTVVGRLEDVDRSIARARAALALTSGGERIVAAGAMTAQLLLASAREEELATQLVREELGRLAEHDAAHGSALVTTLRAYLAHSSSKVRTAQALQIRRQTLYHRLHRIEELIGDVSAPERHTALVLALALDELSATADAERSARDVGSPTRSRQSAH
jgi:purine catabolism regulator